MLSYVYDLADHLWLLAWPLIREWWMWIGGVLFVLHYGLRLVEMMAVGKFRAVQGISDGWSWQKWARQEFLRRREWARFRDMTEPRYVNLIRRKQRRAEKHRERAQILNYLADKASVSVLSLPFYVEILRYRAEKHTAVSSLMDRQVARWDLLRQQIKDAREKIMREEGKDKVLGLMELLRSSSDVTASYALKQLNELRNAFDWSILIPSTLPAATREQMKKILLLIAGTDNLGEARAAFAQAARILTEHRASWGQAA